MVELDLLVKKKWIFYAFTNLFEQIPLCLIVYENTFKLT